MVLFLTSGVLFVFVLIDVTCFLPQPLASQAGLRILQQGGNAAEAAVAVAACLNVTQPNSTGIGGDMFCLYWNNTTKSIHGINGSGRCSSNLNLEKLAAMGYNEQNRPGDYSPLWITVPGYVLF